MSEQIQAIIRLKCIHEFGPHYIPSTIPICPPSVIPEITIVPHGTSLYILLTMWFLHYGYPGVARVLGIWTGVPVMVRWWSDVHDMYLECSHSTGDQMVVSGR